MIDYMLIGKKNIFLFIIVVSIFWITGEDFLFTGASNKPKVIDMQGDNT